MAEAEQTPRMDAADDVLDGMAVKPQHEDVLYAVGTDSPTLETRIDPLADSLEDAADVTITPVIADLGSHQSNHANTGSGEDDDHHDTSDLKTRAKLRTRG